LIARTDDPDNRRRGGGQSEKGVWTSEETGRTIGRERANNRKRAGETIGRDIAEIARALVGGCDLKRQETIQFKYRSKAKLFVRDLMTGQNVIHRESGPVRIELVSVTI
jgi:hypothetical protein